jgi:UDP-N-acetylmuramoyl-tripeptide--D-alanyl-D-alanine ligase
MFKAISLSFISVATIIFFSHRLLCYLRHFQEGGYSRTQFKNWLSTNGIYDKKGSSIATMTALALELTERGKMISLGICTLGAIGLIWLSIWEPDPRKAEEFPLQPTRRATRIYSLALALYSIGLTLTIFGVYKLGAGNEIACYWLVVIVAIQSSPLWLVMASTLVRH